MKKTILLLITLLTLNVVQAQKKIEKLKEYKASNKITYKIGDKIKLGKGSNPNGEFNYVFMGGWAMSTDKLGPANSNLIVTIKKIKSYNYKRFKGVYFTVGGGNITNYLIDIENAIATCEVENCIKEIQKVKVVGNVTDKYDKLKKIKKLFDEGILTKEEYQAEKKKILKEN